MCLHFCCEYQLVYTYVPTWFNINRCQLATWCVSEFDSINGFFSPRNKRKWHYRAVVWGKINEGEAGHFRGRKKNRPIRTSVFSNYSVFSLGVHGTFDTNGGLHRAKMKKGKQITGSLKATLESKSQASTK